MPKFVRDRSRLHAGALIVAGYVMLAVAIGFEGGGFGVRLFGADVSPISSASANAILSAIASGMMALTAIVFSLVFVAVQYSGTSYSPRLARLISAKPFLAHALGIFAGTFMYALVALRTVDIAGGPGIDLYVVGFAFAWLGASVAVLVMLLPRIRGLSIADVLRDLHEHGSAAGCRIYPAGGTHIETADRAADAPPASELVHAGRPRYLVGLDVGRLVRVAREVDAVVVIPVAIGDVVVSGDVLATVRGGTRPIAERRLRRAIWLDDERFVPNDPAYAIRLLVDVAIRALSPAINDPTTAVSVIDELDGLLRVLARRDLESDRVCDENGVVRLVRSVPTWNDFVTLAITEIHQYGYESIQVEHRLAALVHDLLDVLPAERRPAIAQLARWRAETLAEADSGRVVWVDADARDRQGIGHASGLEIAGAGHRG